MPFNPNLQQGAELNNEELCNLFGCSPQGGMRRSLKNEALVLISNRVESLYQDRFVDDVIHYTGMGQVGDQDINSAQNKTLNESKNNGVNVYLFEVLEPRKYTFTGQVELAGEPYQEVQEDVEGNDRKVWMFPLSFTDGQHLRPLPAEKVKNLEVVRERQITRLDREELVHRAKQAAKLPGSRAVVSKQYQRNEYVAEEARRRAQGICQLCSEAAPFTNKTGQPYLEVHHVQWLAKGGEDSLQNTVALCPNCHRKMHVLDRDDDKQFLLSKLT
jgi:5-methylcytosine-specific restriction protein A